MADDDGNTTDPPANPPEGFDRDDLKAAIREVLAEIPSFGGDPPEIDDNDGPGKRAVYTAAEAERIAEAAVRKAMKVLADAKPPKPKATEKPTEKPAAEPPPAPPAGDFWSKVRKVMVGADS